MSNVWITFAWQVEFVAVAILVYGLVIFLRAIIRLDKNFRLALILILSSVVINVAFGIMVGVFLSKGVGESTILDFWIIRPIATMLTALLIMFGARRFLKAIEEEQ